MIDHDIILYYIVVVVTAIEIIGGCVVGEAGGKCDGVALIRSGNDGRCIGSTERSEAKIGGTTEENFRCQ